MKIDLMPMSINDAFRKNMNRTVFIVIALTLAWYMGGCGGNNDVGNPASENTVVFENERLFFQRNYTYRDYASSCRPENIYQNVLSAYINESQTKFQLKAANDTVYLQGELDETLIHSFTDTILDPETNQSETADCFIRLIEDFYGSKLHWECQSDNMRCFIEWW